MKNATLAACLILALTGNALAQGTLDRYGYNSLGTCVPGPGTGGELFVSATPASVDIYVDGLKMGTTPATVPSPLHLNLDPGEHTVRAAKTGYNDYTFAVCLVGGKVTYVPFSLTLVAVQSGLLIVTSAPPGATVYVDGAPAGQTPLTLNQALQISTGTHTVRLELDGYETYTETIAVKAAGGAGVSATLQEKQGAISVSSDPSGASVFLNGVLQGTTPFTIPNLVHGRQYTVTVEKQGYYGSKRDVTVQRGITSSFQSSLKLITGTLEVTSAPSGAAVYIDNRYQGTTPLTKQIPPGDYEVKVQAAWHQDSVQTVRVDAEKTSTQAATLSFNYPLVGAIVGSAVAALAISLYSFRAVRRARFRRQVDSAKERTTKLKAAESGINLTAIAKLLTDADGFNAAALAQAVGLIEQKESAVGGLLHARGEVETVERNLSGLLASEDLHARLSPIKETLMQMSASLADETASMDGMGEVLQSIKSLQQDVETRRKERQEFAAVAQEAEARLSKFREEFPEVNLDRLQAKLASAKDSFDISAVSEFNLEQSTLSGQASSVRDLTQKLATGIKSLTQLRENGFNPVGLEQKIQSLQGRVTESMESVLSGTPSSTDLDDLSHEIEEALKRVGQYNLNLEKIAPMVRSIEQEVAQLKLKEREIYVDDIFKLLGEARSGGDETLLEKAQGLLKAKTEGMNEKAKIAAELEKAQRGKQALSRRLAEGHLDADAYRMAMSDFEQTIAEVKDRLARIDDLLYKEEYEKPI